MKNPSTQERLAIAAMLPAAGRDTRLGDLTRRMFIPLCMGVVFLSALPVQAQLRFSQGARQGALGDRSCPSGVCPLPYRPYPHSYPAPPTYSPQRRPIERAPQPPADDAEPRTDGDAGDDAARPPAPDAAPDATAPTPAPTPDFASVSGATGTPSAPASASPNMIGDFFGVGRQAAVTPRGIFTDSSFGDTGTATVIDPTESTTGRIKQAENYNPLPADRVFLDYSAYQNVPIGTLNGNPADVDVQRFTTGFERTFLDGMMSLELRMPVAFTLNSSVNASGATDPDHFEPGNLNVGLKTLLYEDSRLAVAAGLGVRTPTADDLRFAGGNTLVEVENQSVHLLPFLGMLLTPDQTFFGQILVQVDVDAGGNPIYISSTANPRTFQGDIEDQTFLYTSVTTGAWLYDDPCSRGVTSVAGTFEVHNSTSISNPDTIASDSLLVTPGQTDFQSTTLVAGLHLLYAGGGQVTFGYGVPIGEDRFADSEFRMLLGRTY
ncbi:MAG: hypothetical protein KY475_23585 [Planctomycetes bacterium]|nr:hypothetical protein [Planctomycetota bacterium]